MIVVDPVTLGDTSLSGGGGSYYDKNGALQTAAPGTPRLTYDPADLSKPPALMTEPEATNYIRNNTMQGAARGVIGAGGALPTEWRFNSSTLNGLAREVVDFGVDGGIEYIDIRISGTPTATSGTALLTEGSRTVVGAAGQVWAHSAFYKLAGGNLVNVTALNAAIQQYKSDGLTNGLHRLSIAPTTFDLHLQRLSGTVELNSEATSYIAHGFEFSYTSGLAVDFTLRIGLPQLERDRVTSPIKTSGAAVTRAAETVGSTPGLLYSNVAETEPVWAAGTTYAKDAVVRVAHTVYQSLIASNVGNDPTLAANVSKWLNLGATNRWAMFDDRNNTQTTNAEEIVVALSPRAIAQGLLLGNVDASEIGIAVTVPNFGVVYRETASMVVSTSRSSYFRWAFNRIKRKSLFLTLGLPIFFNGVVTVTLRRPGGIAKCGMCLIGPTVEPGPTLMGLSTEIKDYSTTLFNVDGSSDTIPRGYRKLMSMDVVIDNDKIVEAEDQMIAWRQKTVVWIGAASKLDTIIVGRYSSFKKVIESYPRSKMSLQIEGVLS